MKIKSYEIDKDLLIKNKEESGFEKMFRKAYLEIVNEVKSQILNEDMNELFENMKLQGVENIDDYVINIIDERALIDSITIKVDSRYTSEQADILNSAHDSLSEREFDLLNDSKIPHVNINTINEALKNGTPIEKLEVINLSSISNDTLVEIIDSIDNDFPIKEIELLSRVGRDSNVQGVRVIKKIIKHYGLEPARFAARSEFTTKQRHEIYVALKSNINLLIIKDLFSYKVNEFIMRLIIKGFLEYNLTLFEMKYFQKECIDKKLDYSDARNLLSVINVGSDIYA